LNWICFKLRDLDNALLVLLHICCMTEAKVILPKLFNVTVGAPGSAGCGSPSKNGKQQELPRKKRRMRC